MKTPMREYLTKGGASLAENGTGSEVKVLLDEHPELDLQKALDLLAKPLKKVIGPDEELRYGHPKFYALLDEIGTLHNKKNFDYAEGASQGPLGNFQRVSSLMRLYPNTIRWSSSTGIALAYMLKQLDAALMMFTTEKDSKTGENLGERLRDVAVYALLAIILDEEEKNGL